MDNRNSQYEGRDDSRPFFQRKPREVGIYLTVYDATAAENENISLRHFFLMKTTEQLYEELSKLDLVNIRATLTRKQVLKDTYIERFEPGIVLAVGFDTVEQLDALWELHRKSKLNPLMQEVLVTPGILKAISAKSVTLETKLWNDEYEKCKAELEDMPKEIQPVADRDGDKKMIERLKAYQATLGSEISSMRDLENEMENTRTSFISCMYSILPHNQTEIKSLKEFERIASSDKAKRLYNRKCIDFYQSIIKKWRSYFTSFDVDIIIPLRQIHSVCETEKQKETKAKIISLIQDMQKLLQLETSQQKTVFSELARKIVRRDTPLFLGLLSLVPMGVERVSDVDLMLDEYMRDLKI